MSASDHDDDLFGEEDEDDDQNAQVNQAGAERNEEPEDDLMDGNNGSGSGFQSRIGSSSHERRRDDDLEGDTEDVRPDQRDIEMEDRTARADSLGSSRSQSVPMNGTNDLGEVPSASAGSRQSTFSTGSSSNVQPHLIRRKLFKSMLKPAAKPSDTALLSYDPFVVIPQPGPTHSLASSVCLSYLLTGSEDGYVRSYDFYASVNGKANMSTQQRSMANLGDGVNKAGVPRGYWKNEFEIDEAIESAKPKEQAGRFNFLMGSSNNIKSAPVETRRVRRLEPVYSMAMQGDALWSVQGGKSGLINLTTVRHSPGTVVHVLGGEDGHKQAVAALQILPDETGLISGSWDRTVKDWDLNTGQVVRTFTSHKAQISAVQLRPVAQAPTVPSPVASPPLRPSGLSISIDGDLKASTAESSTKAVANGDAAAGGAEGNADEDAKSPNDYDSLFGDEDDEEGGVKKDEPSEEPSEDAKKAGSPPNKSPAEAPPLPKPTPANLSVVKPEKPRRPPSSALAARKTARPGLPTLTPAEYNEFSDDVMVVASFDGEVALHDRRVHQSKACWSSDGTQVIAGRRNCSLDVWDVRRMGRSGTTSTPNLLRNLKNPAVSKEVSYVAAFPDGQHIACASYDTVRIWNTAQLWDPDSNMRKGKSGVPFRTIAGHHGGMVSSMLIDKTGRFLITASGDRGWFGDATKVVLIHELKQ